MITQRSQHSCSQASVRPLVCMNHPFICARKTGIVPFIRKILPIVRSFDRQRGFTLIELLITVIVLGVLLGIGVPNLRNFIQNSRITTQSNDMIGALAVARSEAIKRNKTVVLCRSADPTAATPACATGGTGTWETGWLLFQDGDGSNTFSTPADELLQIHEAIPAGMTLRGNSAQLTDYLAFAPSGMTKLTAPNAGDPAHHFKLCDTRGTAFGRAVVLETTGRVRISRQSTFSSLSCP